MNPHMSTWLRLTLVTMTVGGGFTGVVVGSEAPFTPAAKTPAFVVFAVVTFLLYLFVLIAGLLFVYDARRTTPLVVALGLQIPVISSPLVAYRFGAGLYAAVGYATTGFFLRIRFGADFQLFLLRPLPAGLGVNLTAVVLLAALSWSMRPRLTAGLG